MVGYGTTKIYEGMKTALFQRGGKMAELHIGWRAKSSVRFLKPQKPPAKIKAGIRAGIKSNNLKI
jgi:hypothetical protein